MMVFEGEFVAPQLNWATLTPLMIVLGAAVLSVLIAAFTPRGARWVTQVGLCLVTLLAALVALAWQWPTGVAPAGRMVVGTGGEQPMMSLLVDRPTLLLQAAVVLFAIVSVLVMAERTTGDEPFAPSAAAIPGSDYEREARAAGLTVSEVFPLVLFAVGGMMAFMAAGDLLTMFVALEVFSLPLYILCGLAARRRLISQEASLKYFLLGAFASAFFLFGLAFIYVFTGSVSLLDISALQVPPGEPIPPVFVVAFGFVLVGLLFKVGAAPFHSWTPDVYEGAPTPVTGFMAACTKIAAFGALLRVLLAFNQLTMIVVPVIATVAVASMVLGVLVAIRQQNVKRMLAYSSIAHAGFILTAMTAATPSSYGAVLFYVVTYGLTTVASFGVAALVRERTPSGDIAGEARTLDQWTGLAHRAPLLAGTFTLLLLATAGIPLTSGFVGKFAVFRAAVENDQAWLAVVGVLASAVAAYFYIRVIAAMYSSVDSPVCVSLAGRRPMTSAVVGLGVLGTVVLGVYPTPLLDAVDDALDGSLVAPVAQPAR